MKTSMSGPVVLTNEAYLAKLPYRVLAKLPDDQIRFLLTGARIANDVLLHQRLLIAIQNTHQLADKDEQRASTVAWFSAVTLLAGKLWEGHKAIKQLWRPQSPVQLEPAGASAFSELGKQLRRGSPIQKVRNHVAYHYDSKKLLESEAAAFEEHVLSNKEMEWILGSELANTLYLFAMESNTIAILDDIYPKRRKSKQMDMLYVEVTDAAEHMSKFLDRAIMAILTQKGVEADDQVTTEPVNMDNRPMLDELRFPMLTRHG